jgi:predicted phage terminase large subunit-like protein
MNTRWPGPGDIIGWLFENEEQAIIDEMVDDAEKWHCVILPAIYDPDQFPTLPSTCTLEPDWRKPGEALFPERYGTDRLRKIKRTQGTYYWASLYQQNPTDREGHRFKRIWFQNKFVDRAPESFSKDIAYFDHGGGENRDNDPTVGVRMRRVSSTEYYIVDVVRRKLSPEKRDQFIRQTAERWGKKVTYWGMQEGGSAGKDQARTFRALLEGFEVYTERVTGEKDIRGDPFQAACEAGFIHLVRGPWNTEFLDELVTLWTGKHDDQGECAAGAYNKLSFLYRRKRKPPGSRSYSTLGH